MGDIEEQQNSHGERAAAWEHIWGGDMIWGMVHSGKGFRFLPGAQWEPQRDLSSGCLLSAMFEKAVPGIAVREPRQWLRGAGWAESPEGWIGGC